jgi:hypothetical protein
VTVDLDSVHQKHTSSRCFVVSLLLFLAKMYCNIYVLYVVLQEQ